MRKNQPEKRKRASKKLRVTICIDPDLRDWIEEQAAEMDRSVSSFVSLSLKSVRRTGATIEVIGGQPGLRAIEGGAVERKTNGGKH